jgi:Flp pilus assembly protein TadD
VSALALGRRERRMVAAWGVALLTGATAYSLAAAAHRLLPQASPLEELAYYPSGVSLKPAVLGHGETAADLAWLRAVQYYGEHRRSDNRFERMPHVFEILTTLAPRFESPYVFGAFALAQEGRDFAGAERLMQKGMDANPRSGRLAFEMGFLYFVRPGGRDLRSAAQYFEQAARQPDAPPAAERFAAYSRQNAGDLRLAYELWSEVYRTSPNRYLRDMAARSMMRIRAAIERGRADLVVKHLAVPRVTVGSR